MVEMVGLTQPVLLALQIQEVAAAVVGLTLLAQLLTAATAAPAL